MASPDAPLLCAIGILSPPQYVDRRDAIRATWLARAPPSILARFAVRSLRCEDSAGTDANTAAAVEDRNDVVRLPVCLNEPRWRGAVLSIYAWLRHAATAYPQARFIGRTDDDIWLDLVALELYLEAVVRYGAPYVVLGRMWYASWVANGTSERQIGFGYSCVQAAAGYSRFAQAANVHTLEPGEAAAAGRASSDGPFVFAPGYLTIMSTPLATTLVGSEELQDNLERVRSQGGRFGLEDMWMGSAMKRHLRNHPIHYVNLYSSWLISDAFGVQARSVTLLWHNRVKDPWRIHILHNFSRRHGCLATNPPRRLRTPRVTCEPTPRENRCDRKHTPNASWCTVSPLCEMREFQHREPWTDTDWFRCKRMAGRRCINGTNASNEVTSASWHS